MGHAILQFCDMMALEYKESRYAGVNSYTGHSWTESEQERGTKDHINGERNKEIERPRTTSLPSISWRLMPDDAGSCGNTVP